MLISLRQPIEVPSGLWGNMTLMALTARPPRRGNDDRPRLAIAAIRHYAAWGYYDQFGHDHPQNPRGGNRSRADRRAGLELVFSDFKKGVDAGRLFLSSLYATDPSARKAGFATIRFRQLDDASMKFPAIPHVAQLNRAAAEEKTADSQYIRQARWDSWLSTIHIGASFALLIDGNSMLQGNRDWKVFCRSLLFIEENAQIPQVVVANANMLLKAAEDCHFFQKAKPRPLLLRV